jgi:hypothetical protein
MARAGGSLGASARHLCARGGRLRPLLRHRLLRELQGLRARENLDVLQGDTTLPWNVRAQAAKEGRRYFLHALSASRRALVAPSLVAVGGIIASGKSTVAQWIALELGAPIVDADRTRKHMLGVEPTHHMNDGAWAGPTIPRSPSVCTAKFCAGPRSCSLPGARSSSMRLSGPRPCDGTRGGWLQGLDSLSSSSNAEPRRRYVAHASSSGPRVGASRTVGSTCSMSSSLASRP